MKERFTPKMFMHYIASRKDINIEDMGVRPIVVLSWWTGVIKSLAEATGAHLSKNWIYGERHPLYVGDVEDSHVCFCSAPVGAPATVMLMEELIACGARFFFGLGWAGSLQQKAPTGAFLLPTSCISEEGTSAHYVTPGTRLVPSKRLVIIIQEVCQGRGHSVHLGPIWTTDAPYRELQTKIKSYRKEGVLGVDMETSAMYALGQFRKVEVCNLLVVSDELWHGWRPAFISAKLREGVRLATDIIKDCLVKDLK
ncbi:MAG: nucleoside phosphorylase [Promethearchaeota archaeon]